MPILMHADDVRHRLQTQATGVVTYPELQAHLDLVERAGAMELPELFDATGATTTLTGDQVRATVRRVHAWLRRGAVGPTAIVATNDTVFGMARMYQLLAETDDMVVGVFRDLAAAERWLRRRERPAAPDDASPATLDSPSAGR